MRVALFTETYFPSVNGVAAHVKTLRDGLIKLGNDVLVVTADKHCKHHFIKDGILHCPSIEVKRFYGFGVAAPYSRKRARLIADFAPDVIHIHHEFGIGISGIFSARQLDIPLVYTLHTMYDQYIYYIAPPALLQTATRFSHKYERFIARNATAITGPSKKCGEYFERIGVQKKVNLIPNAVDAEIFDPDQFTREEKKALRSRYGIPKDRVVCCFAGRLGQEKSVDVLLEYWAKAVRTSDNLHLLIIGDGPEQDALQQLAGKLQLKGTVSFAGFVDHSEMPLHFSACDLYATASLSEMNSISMLEGMASGLPILQLYDEMNADQIHTGVNGYLFHTAEEFTEKLQEFCALSPDARAELKQSAIDSVRSRGSADLAEYMLGIYKKAQQDKRRSPLPTRYSPRASRQVAKQVNDTDIDNKT